jgi:hypothetical protein
MAFETRRLSENVAVALGEQTQHLGVVGRLDSHRPRSTQGAQSHRQGIVGIVGIDRFVANTRT